MEYIKLIIFDLDGTLVDSKQAIAKGINLALQQQGICRKAKEEIYSYIGTGVDDLINKSLGPQNQGLLQKTKAIYENYMNSSSNNILLYPGVREILDCFKDKTKVVITNRKKAFARWPLEKMGIIDYFADIVGADDVACMKPSPCPLDYALDKFKADKQKTIIVGDMDIDILAGKRAGILTCAVTYGIGRRQDIIKTKPDFIIDHILGLKEIIN